MNDDTMIIDMHGSAKSCTGCTHWIPNTVVDDGNRPCNYCSRRYQDHYTPTIHTVSAVNNKGDNYEKGR